MNDYNISDYGIFSSAVSTTNACSNSVTTAKDGVALCKTVVGNQGTFMGPIAEKCVAALDGLDADCANIITNLGSMSSYLMQTSGNYQNADQNANSVIAGLGAGATLIGTSQNSQAAVTSGAMRTYTYGGKTFNITNSPINLDDYQAHLQKNGLYQNAGLLGSRCDMLSGYYAMDLLRGSYTSKGTMEAGSGGSCYNLNRTVSDVNVEPIMQYTYDELSKGNPVVLQVTQKRSNEGLRHFVTVVGYSSNVTSYKDLTPENLLVIDCVDGKVQTLNERNRTYYNQKGTYYAKAPTEEYLAKVNG
jgi:hypothetical protein